MIRLLFFVILTQFLISNPIGRVVEVSGDAIVVRENKSLKLKAFDEIWQNDIVTVLDKSSIRVLLEDNSSITIGQNSSFNFKLYRLSDTIERKKRFFSTLNDSIQKLSPQKFKLQNRSAVIGFRSPAPKTLPISPLSCKITLPTMGKLISEGNKTATYEVNNTQDELLELYTIRLPKRVFLANLTIFPNSEGFEVILREFDSKVEATKEYSVKFTKDDSKLKIGCINLKGI